MRPELCLQALRIAHAARLVLDVAEVHGLQALQALRTRARTSSSGEPLLLDDQDRRL